MNRWLGIVALSTGLAAWACSGGSKNTPTPTSNQAAADDTSNQTADSDPYTIFGPLEVGADWQSYTKVNTEPVESEDHGGRFVDTYVNDIGLDAYKRAEAAIPVGTIVVKVSWERDGDQPSNVQGPIFVMEKKSAGYDEENDDWYYAIHWADPPAKMRDKFGRIYWRSPSPKVKYCLDCHNSYERQLGMVPEAKRTW